MLLTGLFITLSLFAVQEIPKHVATTPADRLSEDWWRQRHENCEKITKAGGFDVAFLGDSITQGWEGSGKSVWDREFAPLKSANFGFSGDRTEHVLWRLEHGELISAKPKVVVIMIGTNNVGHGSSTPVQTADGVRLIVKKLTNAMPDSKILLLGIFPRGEQPNDPMRVKTHEATQLFSSLDNRKSVHFLDIGYAFLRSDDVLRTTLMPDRLHLDPDGYEIWGKAIKDKLITLLK